MLFYKANEEKDVPEGVVTFLDVLGWKGIWQRQKNAIQTLESLVGEIKKQIDNKEKGTLSLEAESSIMIISDTIVIFSPANDDNATEKIEFHGELCKKAIPKSIKAGIPLRGATSYGQVVIGEKNNIYAGKAIDEAASWHEKANWIGVFMAPSAYFIFSEKKSNSWIKNTPPIKDDIELDTNSVKWFQTTDIYIKNLKKDFLQMSPILPEVLVKYTNTLKFIEENE